MMRYYNFAIAALAAAGLTAATAAQASDAGAPTTTTQAAPGGTLTTSHRPVTPRSRSASSENAPAAAIAVVGELFLWGAMATASDDGVRRPASPE